jgi:hypothetical protein
MRRALSRSPLVLALLFLSGITGFAYARGSGSLVGDGASLEAAPTAETYAGGESAPALGEEEPSEVDSCEVKDCGINHKTSCSISCEPPKTARCSCDCKKRIVLGVCAELKENCRCE